MQDVNDRFNEEFTNAFTNRKASNLNLSRETIEESNTSTDAQISRFDAYSNNKDTTSSPSIQEEGAKFSLADAADKADIAAESKAIEETAKANGTYLKAPNGKKTNLSSKQWVDVRTKRFKAWFGDWELAVLYHRAVVAWSSKDSKGKAQTLIGSIYTRSYYKKISKTRASRPTIKRTLIEETLQR